MLRFLAFASLAALARSASVVPLDRSSVHVQQSGQDYSYTINEQHGVAIEPLPHPQIPVIKISHADDNSIKPERVDVKEQEFKPLQPNIPGSSYQVPVAAIQSYTYLPAHQLAIPYPYGINYPYNLVATL